MDEIYDGFEIKTEQSEASRNKKRIVEKLQKRLIIMSAQILSNNIVNDYLFCLFLFAEFVCIIQQPLMLVLKKIDSQNEVLQYYDQNVLAKHEMLNILINSLLLLNAIIFIALFSMVEYSKENNRWFMKIGFKYLSFNICFFNTALAIPYLMSNFNQISCSALDEQETRCFEELNIALFLLNIMMLVIYEAFSYFYLICLDLNFNNPIEQYHAPWTTLRHSTILIQQGIQIGSSIIFVFSERTFIVIIMLVLVITGLIARNFFKFRHSYYLVYKVDVMDVFFNSFMIIFLLLALLISQTTLPYTFNSLYLLHFISILFATALSYVHNFHRASSLEKFFMNFQHLSDDLDFSTNTVIDYLCSKSKQDGVRIKGLVQLIINESGCEAAQQRQREKFEKYSKYLIKGQVKIPKKKSLNPYNQAGTLLRSLEYSHHQTKKLYPNLNHGQTGTLNKFNNRKKFPPTENENDSIYQTRDRIGISNQQQYQSENIINNDQIDVAQIHITNANEINNLDYPPSPALRKSTHYKQSSQAVNQQQFETYEQQIPEDLVTYNNDMFEESEEEGDEQDQEQLINSMCDYHTPQDVNLICEVIEFFLIQIKSNQNNNEVNQIKYSRLMLLKLRILYLARQTDKLHYLMYMVSQLETITSNFQIRTIKYIFQKKFHQIFQHRLVEKKDKITPTALIFYEHQREHFESKVCKATENMLVLLSDLKLQSTSSDDIMKRFEKSKDIIRISIDLEKRFKAIVNVNAQQIDLVAMYFHFLDQVVHMENEARDVYKIMVDMTHSDKINKRFEQIDISKNKGNGFVLISGNQKDLGMILKINNLVCNMLQYFKDDLYMKKIGVLMPDSIAQYHDQIISSYINLESDRQTLKKSKSKKKYEDLDDDHDRQRRERQKLRQHSRQDKKWHLNKRRQMLMYKTKMGTLLPLTCDFDIYFDINQGIQFLCQAFKQNYIKFAEDQKIQTSNVYIIQTQGYGIVQSCSQNFLKRFGINLTKIIDDRFDITALNEDLFKFDDPDSSLDHDGQALFLNLSVLNSLQSEESKDQIEKYQQKMQMKGLRIMKQMSTKGNLSNDIQGIDESSALMITQQMLFASQLMISNEGSTACFVKREVVYHQPDTKNLRNQSQINHGGDLSYQQSLSKNDRFQSVNATNINLMGGDQSNIDVNTVNVSQFNYRDQTVRNMEQTATVEINPLLDALKTDKVYGIYYYIVFPDGMNSQMKEQAIQLADIQQKRGNNNASMDQTIGNDTFNQNLPFQIHAFQSDMQQNPPLRKHHTNEDGTSGDGTKSEEQFTFASTTSSSTNGSHKDKITELKNENFLGQVPVFVSLFSKIFLFYFILFILVGTVILIVAFNSNRRFFNDIEGINTARQYYTECSISQLLFRAYIDIPNGVEPNSSSVVSNRFGVLHQKIVKSNERLRILNNNLRKFVDESDDSKVKDTFTGSNVIIYDLSEQSTITQRKISLDQSIQLLIGKIQMFFNDIDIDNPVQIKQQLQCNCSLSNKDITYRQKNKLTWNQNEREAYWIIENTNKWMTYWTYEIGTQFLRTSSSQVDEYKKQILILSICCITLSFLCSIAFIPYYLRIKRNLNLNLFLIEKMDLTTIEDIQNQIKQFYRQLSYSKGKYGGRSDQSMINNQINYQQEAQSRNRSPSDKFKGESMQIRKVTSQDSVRKESLITGANQKRLKKDKMGKIDEMAIKNLSLDDQKGGIFIKRGFGQSGIVSKKYAETKHSRRDSDKNYEEQKKAKLRQDLRKGHNLHATGTHQTTNQQFAFVTNEEEFKRIEEDKYESDESHDNEEDESRNDRHESDDSDQNQRKRKRHRNKQEHSGNNQGLNGKQVMSRIEERQQEIVNEKRKSIQQMYFRQKIKIVTISTVFSMILSMFFIVDYFLIADTFDQSVNAIKKFQAFYEIDPQFLTIVQLNREQFLKNETGWFIFDGITELIELYQQCFVISDDLRRLKQNYPSTLQKAVSFLKDVDSDQFCQKIIVNYNISESLETCLTVMDGLFKNGFTNAFNQIINYFYMIQLKYDSMKPSSRDENYLRGELRNQKSIDYVMIYHSYLDETLNLIKTKVTSALISFYDDRTSQFVAVYSIFILVLVVSIFLILCFMMKRIKREIYLARRTIQLIPHKELVKQQNYDIAIRIKY
ncbi:UNKNOWN [Stylonychia lemnae]|uniref:Pas domain s-box family protein n=1 Tax=Stylonychia lemnae TaxID=5949 RepID=A0A078B3I5_STYLE|nr:UNKNOWN [Stylonychia lemnae]|eukprot:CDW89009.1 UNKNOWN [Stylonychia lemnae]